jgi:hypothetical protein
MDGSGGAEEASPAYLRPVGNSSLIIGQHSSTKKDKKKKVKKFQPHLAGVPTIVQLQDQYQQHLRGNRARSNLPEYTNESQAKFTRNSYRTTSND